MKIEYKDADGRLLKLEVSDEIGQFYLSSVEEVKKSDRRNTRTDRHTSLETFVIYLAIKITVMRGMQNDF